MDSNDEMLKKLEVLPGTEYARYALPLDYPPSRAYAPRWGYTKPPIPQLYDFFTEHIDEYRQFLEYLRGVSVVHIPRNYSSQTHPMSPGWLGGAMAPFDELCIYGMTGKYEPKSILEIGSGISTTFFSQAISDFGLQTKLISLDPNPQADIDAICDSVIRESLECVEFAPLINALEKNDILFIDGSHRSFTNSDVTVFFIDILPAIKPGVLIHLHDIVLPWDYNGYFSSWYWNEQYMLAVYLMASRDCVVPLLPTAFICRHPGFCRYFEQPFIENIGMTAEQWTGGGSLWFMKK